LHPGAGCSAPAVGQKSPGKKLGETLTSEDFVNFFTHELPAASVRPPRNPLAQNIASSWAQAGFFKGKIHKVRMHPAVTPATAAYALALGYCVASTVNS